jgi:hypothetical protein
MVCGEKLLVLLDCLEQQAIEIAKAKIDGVVEKMML